MFQKMNIHLNLSNNTIYEVPRRLQEEEVSRSILASKTFLKQEDSSSCSLSSMCSSSSSCDSINDDASSSSSNGPLEDLSDLISHLPIKRGLSNFYEGKSQSYTSLANVKTLEDLMKKGFKDRNYNGARRKKTSRNSTGGILEQTYKSVYSPKAIISKKATKSPSSTLSFLGRTKH